jgi:hypothetical protein
MQPADGTSLERARGDLFLTAVSLGIPLAGYNLVLIERKYSVLLGRGAFLQMPLEAWQKAVFALVLPAEVILLVLTATALLRWLLRATRRGSGLAGLLAGGGYFAAVTIQFEVYRYFKDGIDLELASDLGGGLRDSLAFVASELAGLLPVALGAVTALVVWTVIWRRYSAGLALRLGRSRAVSWLVSRKGLLLANLALALVPAVCMLLSERLTRALERGQAHALYSLPAEYASDFDGDGYGLLLRPRDDAPFDARRYPYAVEIPGNGVDENGLGGDLPQASWPPQMPAWDPALLERRDVLVVVLESARYDLLDAEIGGSPAMPHLRSLPGQRLRVISHLGFTAPGLCGIFKETLVPEEPGVSLFDRFRALGYRTGVFSGQPEDFHKIAQETGMDRADVRWDAARLPLNERMYPGTGRNALVMPGRLVVAKFEEWIAAFPASEHFFAYVNIQEMHFPYNSEKIPCSLVKEPIPRGDITPENRDRLVRTYYNAAREADAVLKRALDALREAGRYESTLVVVVGDHGEELFDDGYIGHGVSISHEQNETIGKVLNSPAPLPATPIGISDIGRVIHNCLARDEARRLPLADPILAMLGGPGSPREIGLFDAHGLRKYDFRHGAWLRQPGPATPFEQMAEDEAVVHVFESYAAHAAAVVHTKHEE